MPKSSQSLREASVQKNVDSLLVDLENEKKSMAKSYVGKGKLTLKRRYSNSMDGDMLSGNVPKFDEE
jgi:hypothetical protein